jgi:hypothetical protein
LKNQKAKKNDDEIEQKDFNNPSTSSVNDQFSLDFFDDSHLMASPLKTTAPQNQDGASEATNFTNVNTSLDLKVENKTPPK